MPGGPPRNRDGKPWWQDSATPNAQEVSKLVQTGWTALIQDKTIGKRIVIGAQGTDSGTVQGNSLNILQIAAPNEYAQQLQLVLGSPKLVPENPTVLAMLADGSIQNATGERDNYDILLHPEPSGVSLMQAIAVIEWGIGGVQYKAEVDFLNGLCINLVASWVRVGAFIDALNTDGLVVDGGAYVFSAFIGPGFPKANNAQRTFYVGDLHNVGTDYAGGGFTGYPSKGYNFLFQGSDPTNFPQNGQAQLWPVPYFAKLATAICSRGANGFGAALNPWDVDIVFFRDTQAQNSLGSFRFTQDIREPCKIPNGAFYFSVHNNLGNPITQPAQVIFDLAI